MKAKSMIFQLVQVRRYNFLNLMVRFELKVAERCRAVQNGGRQDQTIPRGILGTCSSLLAH